MPSVGHLAVGLAAARVTRRPDGPGAWAWAVLLCTMSFLPDADVIAFRLGTLATHSGCAHRIADPLRGGPEADGVGGAAVPPLLHRGTVAASIGRRGATLAGAVSLLFVLARAVTYSTLFIGLLLVFIPARVLGWSGLTAPGSFGFAQWLGLAVVAGGGALALWCILTFALVGRGTPAPFDPPRRLVVLGPYRFVRNPMYLGAAAALGGAALYYQSLALAAYAGVFLLLMNGFVVVYEEPTLRATFGGDYDKYCRDVRRWRPRL